MLWMLYGGKDLLEWTRNGCAGFRQAGWNSAVDQIGQQPREDLSPTHHKIGRINLQGPSKFTMAHNQPVPDGNARILPKHPGIGVQVKSPAKKPGM